MSSLYLCLDVWVGYHTLKNTGWWAEERGGSGEMPVHVTVVYRDRGGQQQRWDHGFLLDNKAQDVLWLNPKTGKREYKTGKTTLRNVTPVLKDSWSHFCFDLLDSNTRKDVKGHQTLPRPATITRIMLYGNGWDFRGAAGNVVLRESK